MSTSLTLGTFRFKDFNIPERVNGGGIQNIAVKQLVGGQRIVDAMGLAQDDITWDGLFFGENCELDVKILDGLRSAGIPLPLVYSSFIYLVIIKDFKHNFERTYQIKYNITCTVIQDLSNPISDISFVSYNDAISQLLSKSNSLSSSIGNTNINSAMAPINSAVNAIPSMEDATSNELVTVQTPTQNAVSVTGTEITVLNSQTFNSNINNNDLADNINNLSDMYLLQGTLTQLLTDITLIEEGAAGAQITVNGGSLFNLAAQYYGDATRWTTIAQANNLSDPQLPGGVVLNLVIPSSSTDSGGLLTP